MKPGRMLIITLITLTLIFVTVSLTYLNRPTNFENTCPDILPEKIFLQKNYRDILTFGYFYYPENPDLFPTWKNGTQMDLIYDWKCKPYFEEGDDLTYFRCDNLTYNGEIEKKFKYGLTINVKRLFGVSFLLLDKGVIKKKSGIDALREYEIVNAQCIIFD